MFSRACVKNSVHRGWVSIPPWQTPQEDTPIGQTLPWADTPPPPNQTATAADGTHPTGMHSCFKVKIIGDQNLTLLREP